MESAVPILEVQGLRVLRPKRRGLSLRPVDLELRRGEVLALLGLDTGGQTLLIDALLGLHRQARGEVRVFGLPARNPRALDRIGTVRRRSGFPSTLKVREVISLVRTHYRNPAPVDELLERFSMTGEADRRTGDLARENQRWLAILLAFAGNPDLILMDHPTAGMDLNWRVQFWEHICDFAGHGGAALVATHLTEDVELAADRVIAFKQGRAIARGTPAEIISGSQLMRVCFQAERSPATRDGLDFVRRDGYWSVDTDDPDRVIAALKRGGIEWANLSIDRGNLHSALLHLSREAGDED